MLGGFSRVVLGLYRACREQPVAAFQNAAFELVKSEVPFDTGLWLTGTLNPASSEGNFHTYHLYKLSPEVLADWARTKDRAVFSHKVFNAPGVTHNCVTSREFGPELAEHSRRYGIEHILATASIAPNAALHELISVYRAGVAQPFSEDERRFMQGIVPHLAETWRVNRMLHLTSACQAARAHLWHSAAADAQGVVHLIEPEFASLLQQEWPEWRGPQLPCELLAPIAAGNGQFIGRTMVVRITGLHNQLLLRGREKSVIDTLSQRKLEVAKYFSSGCTHKEIAASLSLAPATVRNYLNSIYLTLGIGSKAELANILKDYE